MKRIFCLIALVAIAATVSAKKPAKPAPAPAKPAAPVTLNDSISYYLGMNMAPSLKNLGEELNPEMIALGLKAMLADNAEQTGEDEMFLGEYFNLRKPAMMKAKSEAFIAEVAKLPGNLTTESGLVYQIITPGSDEKVEGNQMIRVHYKGTLPDGTVFDSSYERGEPNEFASGNVIAGFSEGVKLIGKGGKIKIWIPSELAYGARGAGAGPIGPFQALVFEVELLDILFAYSED